MQVFPQKVEVVEIDLNRTSFHSQDPHKACKAFSKKPGDDEMGVFTAKYTAPVIARLQRHAPVELGETDIMAVCIGGAQNLLPFEMSQDSLRTCLFYLLF